MRSGSFLFVVISLQFATGEVRAGVVGNFCVPASEIDSRAEMCDDNKYYVQYADRCIDRLESEVQQASAALGKKFVPSQGKTQQLDFRTSLKDYNISSRTLANLIAMADQAILDVKEYEKNLVLPEDWDNPLALDGMDLDEWADELDCFGGSGESITRQLKILSDMREELLGAKKIADLHQNTSTGREGNLNQANSVNGAASNSKAVGAGKVSGKHPPKASDVSGTKKAIEDAKRANQVIQKKP